MSKIELTDTIDDVIVKMTAGNIGALSAILDIIKEHDAIDPQAALGAIGVLGWLDSWEIYGSDIYILFNDKCNRDVRKMLMMLRATQLGFLSQSKVKDMSKDQLRQVTLTDEEWEELDDKVCNKLEDFKRAA